MSALALTATVFRFAPQFFGKVRSDLKRAVLPAPHHPDFSRWTDSGLYVAWIGHSSVMIRMDGFTILTDPVFSNRIGVSLGPVTLGIKRLVAPAAQANACPKPDLVLLSHAHMDHFDLRSLRALENRETAVVTASQTSDLLRIKRYEQVAELKWNESLRMGPVTVRAFEVKHWGARMQSDTYRGYNGYVLESDRYRVLFGGDTAMTDTFRALRGLGRIDLAILPIGAYNPWIRVHCNPEEALRMANDAGAEFVLPVHHRTFSLSQEPADEPMERY